MAAFAEHGRTIAALIEVGDRLRTGEHPDDFITVAAVYPRERYIKFEARMFDNSIQVLRVGNTDVVRLLTFEVEADEEAVEAE